MSIIPRAKSGCRNPPNPATAIARRPTAFWILIISIMLVMSVNSYGEELDPRIFGRWQSTYYDEQFECEITSFYQILKDGAEGKIVSSIKFPESCKPATADILGEQTHRIKAISKGKIERENVDPNVISKLVCLALDCKVIARYEFKDDDTLIYKRNNGEENEYLRVE